MIKKIQLLLLILVLQIGLVAYLWFYDVETEASGVDQVLLDIKNLSDVDKIILEAEDKEVILVKKDSQWSMPEYQGLPVNKGLLDSLLNKLNTTNLGWVVAQTDSAAERFHLADTNSKRHLVIYANDNKQADLFFGDSPGLNSIYVRKNSDKNVYNIKLGLHLLSTKQNDWLDKNLLQVMGGVTGLSGEGFKLHKTDGVWRLDDLTAEEEMNADEVNLLVSYLEKIQVEGLVDNIKEKPDLSYQVSVGDQQVKYEFYKNEDNYAVKSSQQAYFFKIASYFYENMQKMQRSSFIK